MKNLTINPQLKIEKFMIPGTQVYAYVVDDFLLDTSSVMNFAHNIAYFNPMFSDNSFYPGIRDNMPQPYLRLLHAFFQNEILPKIENKNYHESILHKSLLSLVSCKPANLIVDQKVPHIDSCDERDYAFVHYLSGEELGGTSIYKYIPQNIIEFKEQHKPLLADIVNDVKNNPDEHQGYLAGTTSLFEQVFKIDAKFNRLVIYQGNLLHSANIYSEQSCLADAKKGRLSIASFASVR
ncbi:MAG: hypothetical protein ACI9H9_000026 [Pseudoalteromonas tetraodonis]|jgi:hypothetical protein|uniref:DUF6445 family protein n=1 Tax=Pseudoalteromonas tetraodonis TaxID=43659 RepID=UPI00398933E8